MNPFTSKGQTIPIASINSVYVEDQKASDLFRLRILVQEIESQREVLGIPKHVTGNDVLIYFNEALQSETPSIMTKAFDIANDFGERLASIICTLKKPSKQSRINRSDWTETHWEYWKNVQNITFVGGLTSPILTNVFLEKINEKLKDIGINNTTVSFIEGSSNLGTIGLSNKVTDGEYLLFDFGQTNIKRAHTIKKENQTILQRLLEPKNSDFLFYRYRDEKELLKIANKLHDYIVKVIRKTSKEVQFKGSNIKIAIANYVKDGKIYSSRGGYGKLALLSDNYQSYLQDTLSKKLGKTINVELYHDTTAMSFALEENTRGAIISLGTAFGIAFID